MQERTFTHSGRIGNQLDHLNQAFRKAAIPTPRPTVICSGAVSCRVDKCQHYDKHELDFHKGCGFGCFDGCHCRLVEGK